MKNLIAMCIICTVLSGCSLKISGGVAWDGYYPEGTTAKGGSFGDPHNSRREAMGPATGQIRNNQGNDTDAFLRRFFDTAPKKMSARN